MCNATIVERVFVYFDLSAMKVGAVAKVSWSRHFAFRVIVEAVGVAGHCICRGSVVLAVIVVIGGSMHAHRFCWTVVWCQRHALSGCQVTRPVKRIGQGRKALQVIAEGHVIPIVGQVNDIIEGRG